MREDAILEALQELERWQARLQSLEQETHKAERQVAYYQALVRDMKRDVQPARLDDLLRAIG